MLLKNFLKAIDIFLFHCNNECTNCTSTLERRDVMIVIDYHDKRPIYEQIIERFQLLILNGALEPDTQLPSVRALAVELSINANTIQRAYGELERRGLIYSVKGRGNFVSARKSVVKEQQQKILDDLRIQLKVCKESGIEGQDILACIQEIFQEVKK